VSELRLKAGIVGAGVFGGYHAQKYVDLPDVEFVAVADTSKPAARKAALRYGARALSDIGAFADLVDIATISTPATSHYSVARQLIDAGVHVLVEKPLALTLEEADDLIERGRTRGVTIQVGHQERFVLAATGLLARDKEPRVITSRRAGPWTGRCTDVGVVMDLMIHDLDLCHQLVAGPVVTAVADGLRLHSEDADELGADLTFEGGCRAHLFASRISDRRERMMRIEYDDGIVEIDFVKRTMVNTTPARLTPLGEGDARQRAIVGDPLGFAVGEFVRAVRGGHEPFVNGQAARRALATALAILAVAECREAVAA